MTKDNSDIKYYSLSKLMESISAVIHRTYNQSYWIKAEMVKLNYYKKSGHCYPDLVEKSNGDIRAQIRATFWSNTYYRTNANFLKKTGKTLGDGMNILFLAQVKHDALHGLTLNIIDIDADYELGQLAKSKNECILRLKQEGLFDLNRKLPFSMLPKRIALISVETSKGYQDFVNILNGNTRGYRFFHMLFPALLQGDAAVHSIIEQLDRIRSVSHHFDMVAIIRGGGGDVGLACYDDYYLAAEVARFPLPVLSGIGHASNLTVVEMVANYNPITPTDLAYFLQQSYDNNAVRIQEIQQTWAKNAELILRKQRDKMSTISQVVKNRSMLIVQKEYHQISKLKQDLILQSKFILKSKHIIIIRSEKDIRLLSSKLFQLENSKISNYRNLLLPNAKSLIVKSKVKIDHYSEKIELMKPENLLKKGYSLSLHNGKPIIDIDGLSVGDMMITRVYKGEIKSKISKIEKYEN